MQHLEYDAAINYEEGSIASFNGVNKAFLKNPLNSFKLEWVAIPHLSNQIWDSNNAKPSLMVMLKDFIDTFGHKPNDVSQRFLIEQYKVEFDHWSRNN